MFPTRSFTADVEAEGLYTPSGWECPSFICFKGMCITVLIFMTLTSKSLSGDSKIGFISTMASITGPFTFKLRFTWFPDGVGHRVSEPGAGFPGPSVARSCCGGTLALVSLVWLIFGQKNPNLEGRIHAAHKENPSFLLLVSHSLSSLFGFILLSCSSS